MTRVVPAGMLLLGLALATLASSAGCSTVASGHSTFDRRFDRCLFLAGSKAMATAGDLHGQLVYGIGYGWLSTGRAIDKAFEEGDVRRNDLRVASKCQLYAVDSQVVMGNSELEARYGRR